MDVGEKLKETLEKLEYPAYRLYTTDNPQTYFTFETINISPENFGDDDYETEIHTIRVHLFTKKSYSKLLKDIKAALKKEGFIIVNVDGEILEKDTGYYHIPINIKYMEVLSEWQP